MNPESRHDLAQVAAVPTSHDLVGLYFDHLRGEIVNILNSDSALRTQISKLEQELTVYKRAYSVLESEKARLETLNQDGERQREELENKVKAHRVVALIDGDGAIFDSALIEQGQSGGHTAALKLDGSIKRYITNAEGTSDYQLWVYVFLNKRGLADTLGRVGLIAAKHKLDEFVIGFNQAAERFMMLDVGNAKEAADAKIKVVLDSEIRMPQTTKVIFGGCHDNGYVTTLRSHITAGFKDKLILLPSYNEIATGISELELPLLTIPALFVSQKFSYSTPFGTNMAATTSAPAYGTAVKIGNGSPEKVKLLFQDKETTQTFSFEPPDLETSRSPRPLSYSTMLRGMPLGQQRSISPPESYSSESNTSDDTDDVLPRPRAAPPISKTSRRINPTLALSKQKPPPCTLFYLANCRHGAECKYGHDYILEPEHYAEIQENAKKAPCPAINKGEVCTWGDACCYGHKCPSTTKCYFFKQGRCKFIGSDMHRD